MTASEALKLVKSIPKRNWTVNEYTDGISKCCFTGHLHRLISNDPNDYGLKNCSTHHKEGLTKFFIEVFAVCGNFPFMINDIQVGVYQEDHPKDRVIHLLQDMIKAGH